MNNKQFYDTVKRMREAQKEYFRTRDKRILIRSINLESAVDGMIQEEEKSKTPNQLQLDLFPKE